MGSFVRTDVDEPVDIFHRREHRDRGRQLWVPRLPDRPVLVLGSTQAESVIDTERAAAAATPIVRRRSGGGAVLVSADDIVWFDVLIGRDDPLWRDDVGAAFEWVGEACRRGLRTLGYQTEVHYGRSERSEWSRRICFAGLASGELTLGQSKLVGISQRRSRAGARFQVALLRRWEPDRYLDLFRLGEPERREASRELADRATGIGDDPAQIIDALEAALP